MDEKTNLPRLSRIAFFTSKNDEFFHAINAAIRQCAVERPDWAPSESQLAIYAWGKAIVDVPNGGFTQFFFNLRGDAGVQRLCGLLGSLNLSQLAEAFEQALKVYRAHRDAFKVRDPWKGLFGSIKEFEGPDQTFGKIDLTAASASLEEWSRKHVHELVVGDDGKPVDTSFTGTLEVRSSDGLTSQMLEMTNGKANGAYREFFEDGSVREFRFYENGEPMGTFWPNGRLREKESLEGDRKIVEWYYPSGKLQKRFVTDRKRAFAEPVRLYHENGQLAEEMAVKNGKTHGLWLKFFDDGSPRLQAEYINRMPVVRNAWDVNRQQVVKDGSGVFDDDGLRIDNRSSKLGNLMAQRRVMELKDGLQHGITTTYAKGVVSEVQNYVNGKLNGESTTYWENGRIREITLYNMGEEVESKSFPKFDRPVPAVLLKLEADETLYDAWRHIAVDHYPVATNLDEIRADLKIPQFLRDVHDRIVAGSQKRNENFDSFQDTIAYFVDVDATGRVINAKANGSGGYSGGQWNTYLPLLKRLCFRPGSVRGRTVNCRVLARVSHTFTEGAVTA